MTVEWQQTIVLLSMLVLMLHILHSMGEAGHNTQIL